MHWRRGERDQVAKAFVSHDEEAELYSGATGRWGVRGEGGVTHMQERVGMLTLLGLRYRQLTFTANKGMDWTREGLEDRDKSCRLEISDVLMWRV